MRSAAFGLKRARSICVSCFASALVLVLLISGCSPSPQLRTQSSAWLSRLPASTVAAVAIDLSDQEQARQIRQWIQPALIASLDRVFAARERADLAGLDLLEVEARAAYASTFDESMAAPSRLYVFETYPKKEALERLEEIIDALAVGSAWTSFSERDARSWRWRSAHSTTLQEEVWIEIRDDRLGVLSASGAMIEVAARIKSAKQAPPLEESIDILERLRSQRSPISLWLNAREIGRMPTAKSAPSADPPSYGQEISRELIASLIGGFDDLTFAYRFSEQGLVYSGSGEFREDVSDFAEVLLQPRPLDLEYLAQRRLPKVGGTWAFSLVDFRRGFDQVMLQLPAEIETATRLGLNIASLSSGLSLENDLFPALGPTVAYSKIPPGNSLPDGWALALQVDPARRHLVERFFDGLVGLGQLAEGKAEGAPPSLRSWFKQGKSERTIVALSSDTLVFSSQLRLALQMALPSGDEKQRRLLRERIAAQQPEGRPVLFRISDGSLRSWGFSDESTLHHWAGTFAEKLSNHLAGAETICAVEAQAMHCNGAIFHRRDPNALGRLDE